MEFQTKMLANGEPLNVVTKSFVSPHTQSVTEATSNQCSSSTHPMREQTKWRLVGGLLLRSVSTWCTAICMYIWMCVFTSKLDDIYGILSIVKFQLIYQQNNVSIVCRGHCKISVFSKESIPHAPSFKAKQNEVWTMV